MCIGYLKDAMVHNRAAHRVYCLVYKMHIKR